MSINGALAEEYFQHRLKTRVTPATINREFATPIRMLRLGYEREKVGKLPVIHKLTDAAPRSGFFERTDFEAVRRQLRPDLQCAVTIAHSYGWRMQSEVLTLGLSHIDLIAGTMRINPGGSTTGEGRVVDRYNIVSPGDLQDAAPKMADGHNLRHNALSPLDSVTVSR